MAVLSRPAVSRYFAVRREGDAEHPVGVVLDRLLQLRLGRPAGQVPDAHGPVAAAGDQPLAVRRHGQAQHRVVGVEQLLDHHLRVVHAVEVWRRRRLPSPASREVEDADVALLPRPAAGDDELAVRQERHRVGALGPGADPLHELAVGDGPDGQLVVPADDELLAVRA